MRLAPILTSLFVLLPLKEFTVAKGACEDCSCSAADRIDCHPEPNANEIQCISRECIWCPLYGQPGPWCAKRIKEICTSCVCESRIRFDCHPEHGATAKACHSRGCRWCPIPGKIGPWCIKTGESTCTSCDCTEKYSCGSGDQQTCEAKGCTWCASSNPKCILMEVSELLTTPKCSSCACFANGRIDCHPEQDATEVKCHSRGCLWCPISTQGPWCIDVGSTCTSCECETRFDCHPQPYATEATCVAKGCSWCPVFKQMPWCFPVNKEGVNKWTECTRSCGGGNRYKFSQCSKNEITECPRIYKDCNTQDCETVTCSTLEIYRYGMKSSCCKHSNVTRCGVNGVNTRIVGGSLSAFGLWPWMILFLAGETELCGAVLVSEKWALTAAHCTEGKDAAEIVLKLGIVNVQSSSQATLLQLGVLRYISHPQYNFPLNDLSLLKLNAAVPSTTATKPICLPKGEEPLEDMQCFVSGWGASSSGGMAENKLHHAAIRVLPFDLCYERYSDSYPMSKNAMICAGRIEGKIDSCQGDSGGPLMCQRCSSCSWYVAGLVSFGIDCAKAGSPGVYTKVSYYEQWLKEQKLTASETAVHNCSKFP